MCLVPFALDLSDSVRHSMESAYLAFDFVPTIAALLTSSEFIEPALAFLTRFALNSPGYFFLMNSKLYI